jgi:hypothetical protein
MALLRDTVIGLLYRAYKRLARRVSDASGSIPITHAIS